APTTSPLFPYTTLFRSFARHVARERHHRGRAEQADMHARGCELGGRRRDREIAGGDELTAGCGGGCLDRSNHGLWQSQQGEHHRSEEHTSELQSLTNLV